MLVSSRMVAGFPSHSSADNSRISRPGRTAATTESSFRLGSVSHIEALKGNLEIWIFVS